MRKYQIFDRNLVPMGFTLTAANVTDALEMAKDQFNGGPFAVAPETPAPRPVRQPDHFAVGEEEDE